MAKKTPKPTPKKKIRTTPILKELLELQSQLIKDHDAIPGKEGYLNWTPQRAQEWKTKQKLLEKEKKKLEIEFKKAAEEEAQFSIKGGLGALFLAGAIQNEGAMGLATTYLAAGIGQKIFGGLFKKKDKEIEEDETLDQTSSESKVGKPEKVNKDAMDPKKIALLQMDDSTGLNDDRETTLRFGKKKKYKENDIPIGSPEKIIKEETSPSDAIRSFYERGGAQPKEYSLTPGAPEKIEGKPGFLMTAEEKIRAREERINSEKVIPAGAPEKIESKPGFLMTAEIAKKADAERDEKNIRRLAVGMRAENSAKINSEKLIPAGAPEKIEGKKENISSDNDAIISILNKILASFQADNERMRRAIRGSEEKKLESDPTPDAPGAPVKEGDDKKSGMNKKLLMFGAIAGLLGLAYTFKDEIAKILEPITNMLGITNPLEESDKEDYEFDIMDALGVTALLGMLGITPTIPGKGPPKVPGVPPKVSGAPPGAPEKPGFLKTQEERIRERGARMSAERSAGAPVKKGLAAAKMIARGLGPIAAVLGAYSLMNDLDEIEQEFKNGELTKEQYKEDYATAVGGFLGGSAGSVALASVGAILGAPVAGVGGIVGGVVGGVAGFFAGEAIGKYLGGTIGATMVGDPAPEIPKPKEFTEDDQNKLKEALKDEKIREKLSPGHLGILNKLANVNLKSGGLAARKAMKMGTEAAGNALADMSKSESAKSSISSGGGAAAGAAGGAAGGGAAPSSAAASSSSGMSSASGVSGSPVPSAPPPASETSGSAIASATMESSAAQNTVTILPPIINNQTNTSSSNPARESKANKISMQIRMEDEMFRTAINATAAVLKTLKAA